MLLIRKKERKFWKFYVKLHIYYIILVCLESQFKEIIMAIIFFVTLKYLNSYKYNILH